MRTSVNLYFNTNLDSVLKIKAIKDAGYDEFFTGIYDQNETLTWRQQVKLAARCGLRTTMIHCQYREADLNAFWLPGPAGDAVCANYLRQIKACGRYTRNFVIHLNGGFDSQQTPLGLARLQRLLRACEKYQLNLCVENLYSATEIPYIFANLQHPLLKICYDCGHRNFLTKDFDIVANFHQYISVLHLHDNHGQTDEHLMLQPGSTVYQNLCRELPLLAPDVVLASEIKYSASPNYAQVLADNLAALKQVAADAQLPVTPTLVIDQLSKSYGTKLAVDNLSLSLQPGEIFGFIGPNGAGKSTTIRAMLNFIRRDHGQVAYAGEALTAAATALKFRIGYLPSEIALYEQLTGRQMLDYNRRFYAHIDEAYVTSLIQRLQFDDTKKIETYSLGNRKKLGIILCLMHQPDLIIMDEATSGLDPLMQEEFYQILREAKARGATIFYSSHYLEEVKKLCDRIGIIKDGRLIKVDTVANIVAHQGVKVTLHLQAPLPKKALPAQIVLQTPDQIQFYHRGDKASLLALLNLPQVTDFLVTEPALDDVFLHFYQAEKRSEA